MTLTPEQREEIEKVHTEAQATLAAERDWVADFEDANNHRAALLADNKELREKVEILDRACRMYQTQVAALSAAKPQGVGADALKKVVGGVLAKALSEREERYIYRGDDSTQRVTRWGLVEKDIIDGILALTSTQPSPDRLTEEPSQQEVRAWEWVSDIIEKEAKFWIDDANVAHVNNAPAVAHKIVTDSVALQLLRPLIDRLTTPQAPSVPTREQVIKLRDLLADRVREEAGRGHENAARRYSEQVAGVIKVLALFTPSPSPEQRGETP